MIYFLDTSAALNGAYKLYPNIYISPITLQELESLKTSNTKDDKTKYQARETVRELLSSSSIHYTFFTRKEISRVLHKYQFLSDIPDHQILSAAILLSQQEVVNFITSDGAQYLFAQRIPGLDSQFFENKSEEAHAEYCGWSKYYPNIEEMALLYSNPELNVLKCKTNEFAEIFEGRELKDVLFWNGERYKPLNFKTFNSTFGEKIVPRNLEQKMLFHLLQNDDIKIKLCLSSFGSGKTFTMLQHALKGIKDGRFSKIVFVRNNIITKGSRDIGFLGGGLVEKIKPFLMPIADLTSEDYLNEIIETGILEPVPLSFMRGRDFSNSTLIFCDEAENLTTQNMQLLIGRIGEGSEFWCAGDLKQIDHRDFEINNGINHMINRLAGNPLFGMVKLIKSERSKTSQLADLLD